MFKLGRCIVCGRKVKNETMCSTCYQYEMKLAKKEEEKETWKKKYEKFSEEHFKNSTDILRTFNEKQLPSLKASIEKECVNRICDKIINKWQANKLQYEWSGFAKSIEEILDEVKKEAEGE